MTRFTNRFAVAAACASLATVALAAHLGGTAAAPPDHVGGIPVPTAASKPQQSPGTELTWRLNTPTPRVVDAERANPIAGADKFASRVRSNDLRASLRAYEGAPPVIPHPIADLNVQTCRACHSEGLRAGDRVARMVPHATLTNCTQCHVEADPAHDVPASLAVSTFEGRRASGYGGTRAWAGAPPTMPHSLFMRTNCVSCHGEFGYDGWRPDHLDRSNCIQCHAPAAEFDQLSPRFGVPDRADGLEDRAWGTTTATTTATTASTTTAATIEVTPR
ncbi:MAG: hypothetical protein JNL80_04270 [Phycisphaerae bacterium]|nr:hypothetical protein [Phycisphaerae bacterium]